MKKYLKCDITGPYSNIEYGKKGDEVLFIKYQNEFSLVELNRERFHVKNENLSDTPIKENTDAIPDTVEINKVNNPVPVSTSGRKQVKKAAPINKQQSTLF